MRGKLGFFFGSLAAVSLVWAYFRVPEFKVRVFRLDILKYAADLNLQGRTYEELDIMFERGVKTREFKHYVVDREAVHRDA